MLKAFFLIPWIIGEYKRFDHILIALFLIHYENYDTIHTYGPEYKC